MEPESIQQTTGDTPMRRREQLLQRATVALVTPGEVHAWLIRTARGAAQTRFLTNLRVAVTDGAHVHEDVLGSNAAFMFRRLDAATRQQGNGYYIQYIVATATVRSPGNTCRTGPATPSGGSTDEDNGAPTHSIQLLRVPYPRGRKTPNPASPVSSLR